MEWWISTTPYIIIAKDKYMPTQLSDKKIFQVGRCCIDSIGRIGIISKIRFDNHRRIHHIFVLYTALQVGMMHDIRMLRRFNIQELPFKIYNKIVSPYECMILKCKLMCGSIKYADEYLNSFVENVEFLEYTIKK